MLKPKYKVGDRIKFKEEKISYKIVGRNDQFLICTKPFNARKTFLYCIVDLAEKIRGADNYYTLYDYNNLEEVNEALGRLSDGAKLKPYNRSFQISYRRRLGLNIEKHIPVTGAT